MYKSLTIAALAAASALPAFAQSSVTMYGRFNTSIERQRDSGAFGAESTSMNQMVNNSSRLGVKGTEDLGGGLRAGFQLEHGFNSDTGAITRDTFWGRQSEVNLGGGFGTVRLGLFTSEAYYATADYVSMHNHDTGTSSDALYAYIGRDRDKIGYASPSWGGVVLHASVALRETIAGVSDSTRVFDLAANYDAGPLHLGAGFERSGSERNQFAIRALYEAGPFTFGGYYQRDKNGLCADFSCGSRNNFRLSGMYAFGASELHLNVGFAKAYQNIDDSDARQATIAYNYNLSKRTKVYAFYTRIDDGDAGFYRGLAGDFQSLAVGVRHNF
jgi:predicted porin